MSKLGIITRQPQIIENLGAVTVICLDKTGTITENKMEVHGLYDYRTDEYYELINHHYGADSELLYYAMLASEVKPFDAMEKAILNAYCSLAERRERPQMIHEYPLGGQPPMMTHVYETASGKIVAAKGAAERILNICRLNEADYQKVSHQLLGMTATGCRTIGIASATYDSDRFPDSQDDFDWKFEGLISLFDPPKKNISSVFQQFYDAGIKIKLLTGDYSETAIAIAGKIGMVGIERHLTGEQVLQMNHEELEKAVTNFNVFTRMFPEAKTKVIESLKKAGHIVAMTGDGVNDGPALKVADIGIAMGLKGTEIARQAADLVLTDDNIDKIAEALKQGRKIFNNLKKAIRYIISIHIPIISLAIVPLIMGWKYSTVFSPIHIIFLELIMGPTCSVFFEREPVEIHLMKQPPRKRSTALFTGNEMLVSIIQGLIIALGVLAVYYYYMQDHSLPETRSVVFTSLVCANIFLTFINRSFDESIANTIRYKNDLAIPVLIISIIFLCLIQIVPFIRSLFEISIITFQDLMISVMVAFLSTSWFELYKALRRGGSLK